MNPSNWKSFILGGVSVFGEIIEKIMKFTNFVSISKQSDAINEVLFYGVDDEGEKKKVGLNNLFCIYYIIVHASKTIDVCVPTLDSDTISKCLINVHRKNLAKVRIVAHQSNGLKCLKQFLDVGIEVKIINPKLRLEHEFLLIDAEYPDAVAVAGSLDYEVNRVNCNKDKTLLTSEAALMLALKREFDRIWNTVDNVI